MAGAFEGSGRRPGPIAAINVTPLVDVVLVLLIVLMVTATSIVARSIPMDLPSARTGDASQGSLHLSLDKGGTLYLDGEAIAREALPRIIKGRRRGTPELRAVIAADKALAHGVVVSLMDLLRSEGVVRFAIQVTPADGNAP